MSNQPAQKPVQDAITREGSPISSVGSVEEHGEANVTTASGIFCL